MTEYPKHRLQTLKEQVDSLSGHRRVEMDTPIYDELRAELDADRAMSTLFPGLHRLREAK